jgi:hypothetical protein
MAKFIDASTETGRVDGGGNPLPPRVRLDVGWTDAPVPDEIRVVAIDPDGSRRVLRAGDPLTLSAGEGFLYDYEAPFDVPVTYVLESLDASESYTGPAATLESDGTPWAIHPGLPEVSQPLLVAEWPSWSRPIRSGTLAPLGRKFPIVTSQRRSGEVGGMTVYTDSPVAYAGLLDLLDYGVPLLLKGSPLFEDAGSRWVAVGDVRETPIEDGPGSTVTGFVSWSLDLTAVDPPSGQALAAWTYANSNATFSSYADALATAPTFDARSSGDF